MFQSLFLLDKDSEKIVKNCYREGATNSKDKEVSGDSAVGDSVSAEPRESTYSTSQLRSPV